MKIIFLNFVFIFKLGIFSGGKMPQSTEKYVFQSNWLRLWPDFGTHILNIQFYLGYKMILLENEPLILEWFYIWRYSIDHNILHDSSSLLRRILLMYYGNILCF